MTILDPPQDEMQSLLGLIETAVSPNCLSHDIDNFFVFVEHGKI